MFTIHKDASLINGNLISGLGKYTLQQQAITTRAIALINVGSIPGHIKNRTLWWAEGDIRAAYNRFINDSVKTHWQAWRGIDINPADLCTNTQQK